MTFSIVAYDPNGPAWGVAVASKFPAVGAVVPWVRAGAGAVATQSFANTSFGPRALDLMATGIPAAEALERLLQDDPDRQLRQLGLVDSRGHAASFTGSGCFNWAGGVAGNGYAIQGNILYGSAVVPVMEKVFVECQGDLPTRLHAAHLAGDRAGGDKRGRQSAAIYVAKAGAGYGSFNDRWLDYRVDDAPDPVVRLGELIEMHGLYFGESPQEERVMLSGEDVQRLQRILRKQGYLAMDPTGDFDETTRKAFTEFIGNENFEERADPVAGWIDEPVLDFIYRKFEG